MVSEAFGKHTGSNGHATARQHGGQCLLLVDVINGFDFPGSEGLARAAERAAPKIEQLAKRARASKIPVLYVNDNFGQWRSDFAATVEACLGPDQPGRRVTERLKPHEGDYFVLKPHYSGFYCTTLEPLLQFIGARTLVIAGFATNLCVLFTAQDAYMRGFEVVVPADCTASNTLALTRAALTHIETAVHGRIAQSSSITFGASKPKPGKNSRAHAARSHST